MSGKTAADVLSYWFHSEVAPEPRMELWFKKSAETDDFIREQFEPLVRTLASGHAYDWAAEGPKSALAAIIALDQFPRNIYRDTPKAFATDHLAMSLASNMMVMGADHGLALIERWFVYMPLEHAENLTSQKASVAAFAELVNQAPRDEKALFEDALNYAEQHAAVIEKFGRFPHRNAILGRQTTDAEREWLATNGGF